MRNRQLNEGLWQSYVVTQIPDVSAESEKNTAPNHPVEVQRTSAENKKTWVPTSFYKIAFYSLIGVISAQLAFHFFNPQVSQSTTRKDNELVLPSTQAKESIPNSSDAIAGKMTDPAISGHLRKLLEKSENRVEPIQNQQRNQRLITARRKDSNVKR